MARLERTKVSVYGPYPHRRRFRIVVVDERGKKTTCLYETEKQARQVKRSLLRAAGEAMKTLATAIDEYEEFLRNVKENKPTSVDATITRLRGFLGDLELDVHDIDEPIAQAMYDRYRTTKSERTKRAPSVDTHRNVLAEVKTFFGWLVDKRKLVDKNPFAGVEGVGRRRHGKPQLRIDESRKWLAVAVKRADTGDAGAVAAMMTLLLGVRASEVVSRVARDVDDDSPVRNESRVQPPEIVHACFHRTLEVRGSIPLGSTGKRRRLAEMRAVFVSGGRLGNGMNRFCFPSFSHGDHRTPPWSTRSTTSWRCAATASGLA